MRVAAERQHTVSRESAQQRLLEYKADAADVGAQQAALAAELAELTSPLREAEQALQVFRKERHAADARDAEARHTLSQRLALANGVLGRVRSAAREHDGDALEQCAARLASAAEALRDARARAEQADKDVYLLESDVRDTQARSASLADNQRYREVVQDREAVERELATLDLAAAQARHTQATAAYEAARRAEQELSGSAAHVRGEIQGIEAELARRRAELRDEFKDVSERYVAQLVHIKVATMANRDLDTYCGALQQAILQYHGIKMEEVNQTLDYLWKKTYQGTDIDTILVRSDTEGRVASNGMRSYQYRVCMVKDGVELDMRGRCSAGQKVLACILIRLALADSFGAQCGFLALDEPTTNLDRENVEALAASLVECVATTDPALLLSDSTNTTSSSSSLHMTKISFHASRSPMRWGSTGVCRATSSYTPQSSAKRCSALRARCGPSSSH